MKKRHKASCELQHGELYLIKHRGGPRRRRIVQIKADRLNITGPGAPKSLVWWVGDLAGFRQSGDSTLGGIPVFHGLSDGPYQTLDMQSRLIGRVVGVATKPLGALLEPEAGYGNEERANQQFDPGDYLDVLIKAGYGPLVQPVPNGVMYYEVMPDRRVSDKADRAVHAVRAKFFAASTALDRVKQECLRRGLVSGR